MHSLSFFLIIAPTSDILNSSACATFARLPINRSDRVYRNTMEDPQSGVQLQL